ncbi:MAG: flagellar basal body rod C-terminal domain-containing protein, partial [Alphaproteobacteria bacterium]
DLISIKTYAQQSGALTVTTDDGSELIGDNKVQLSYGAAQQSGTDVVYGKISAQLIDSRNGAPLGQPIAFDSHFGQGALRGLLTMRDNDLPNLLEQLGNLAANLSDQLNAAHNDSIAVPPANALTGRQTGLLSTDAADFTGQTTLAIVDSSGKLVHSLSFDFSAGTYTVDNSATAPIPNGAGATIDDIVTAINTGLVGSATASFNNGVMSIAATDPTTGVGFSQPSTNASSRGGRSFSQFFGLNDLVQAMRPSNFDTGLTSADLSAPNSAAYAAGQQFNLLVSDPTGKVLKQFTYTTTGSESLQDIVDAMNDPTNGLGQVMTFALDSNGQLVGTPTAGNPNATLDVTDDNTDRGGTGVSFTAMFGLGRRYQMEQASGLTINPQILAQPGDLALAHLAFDPTTQPGDLVAAIADSTGAQALANLATSTVGFAGAGDLRKTAASLGGYASLVVGNTSNNAATVTQMQQAADAVKTEVESRRTSTEGVNLDEELSNMIIYQQAYNAAARLVTVAKDIYDTLIATVPAQ